MQTNLSLAVIALLLALASGASAQSVDPSVRQQLAPTGVLRVGLNGGNALTQAVGTELARELAKELGVQALFTTYSGPAVVVENVQAWDIAFVAADPDRMATIAFTPAYVLLDATYLVRADSPIAKASDADRAGLKVAAGAGTAYALYLRRELKQAELVTTSTADGVKRVLAGELAGIAALRFDLLKIAAATPGLRVLPDNFTRAQQAVALPKANRAALDYMTTFLTRMKQSGLTAAAIARTGLPGATPAE